MFTAQDAAVCAKYLLALVYTVYAGIKLVLDRKAERRHAEYTKDIIDLRDHINKLSEHPESSPALDERVKKLEHNVFNQMHEFKNRKAS